MQVLIHGAMLIQIRFGVTLANCSDCTNKDSPWAPVSLAALFVVSFMINSCTPWRELHLFSEVRSNSGTNAPMESSGSQTF